MLKRQQIWRLVPHTMRFALWTIHSLRRHHPDRRAAADLLRAYRTAERARLYPLLAAAE